MLVERAIRKASTRDNKEVTPAVLLVRTKIVTLAGESTTEAEARCPRFLP